LGNENNTVWLSLVQVVYPPAITAFLKKFKEYTKNDAAIAQEFELVDMIAHYETGLIDAVNAAAQKWEEFKVDAKGKGPIFLKQSTYE
jgi:hypothetical protein